MKNRWPWIQISVLQQRGKFLIPGITYCRTVLRPVLSSVFWSVFWANGLSRSLTVPHNPIRITSTHECFNLQNTLQNTLNRKQNTFISASRYTCNQRTISVFSFLDDRLYGYRHTVTVSSGFMLSVLLMN